MLFDVGDRVRASVQFRNDSNVLTDPSTIVVTVDPPGTGTQHLTYGVDGAVVRDTTGTYHTDFTLDRDGRWWVEWGGTGALTAAGVLNFLVNAGA